MKTIVAENIRTGETVEFTFEAWTNLKNTGHSKYWRVTDTSALVPDKVTPIVFSEKEEETVDYRQLLIDENIPFNKSIKNPKKLEDIYYEYTSRKENPVVTTPPE